jgi:hypothetical protein
MSSYTQLVHNNMDVDPDDDCNSKSEMRSNIDMDPMNHNMSNNRLTSLSFKDRDRDNTHDKYIKEFDQDIKDLVRDNKYKG